MMNLRQLMMEEETRDKVNDHDRANDLSARQIVDLIMAQEGSAVNANEVSHRLPPVIPTLLSTHSNQGMEIEGKGPVSVATDGALGGRQRSKARAAWVRHARWGGPGEDQMVQSWDGAGRSAPGVASMAPGHSGRGNSCWGGQGEDQMVLSWDGAGRSAPGVASMTPGHPGWGNSRWGGPGEDQMDRSRYDLGRNGPGVDQTTRGHQGRHGSGRGDTGGSFECFGADGDGFSAGGVHPTNPRE